jgi:hypothetical protein
VTSPGSMDIFDSVKRYFGLVYLIPFPSSHDSSHSKQQVDQAPPRVPNRTYDDHHLNGRRLTSKEDP